MKLPERHSLHVFAVIMALFLAGCQDAEFGDERAWRIVVGDAQGAVVVEGMTIRGYLRGSGGPAWQVRGELTGAACATTCADTFLTFADRPGLFLTHGQEVVAQEVPTTGGRLRVLLARDREVVLVQTTTQGSRLLAWSPEKVVPLQQLGKGIPMWYGSATKGTLFLVGERSVSGVTVSIEGETISHQPLARLPHDLICYDASNVGTSALPDAVFRTLKRELAHLSTCLAGPDSQWLGISTYMTMSPDNPDGRPSVAVAAAGPNGELAWSRSFQADNFGLSPQGGRELMIVRGEEVEILDTMSGRQVQHLTDVADARYVGSSRFSVVRVFTPPSVSARRP